MYGYNGWYDDYGYRRTPIAPPPAPTPITGAVK